VQVNAIAQPMADRSLAKKIYKLVRKACTTDKKKYGRGVADVQRMLRKNIKGIVILAGSVTIRCVSYTLGAGNVHPVDVYAHIAAICESQGVAYCYTPSREHLGLAAGQRRSSILCLVQRLDAYEKLYDEVHTAIMAMPPPTPVALPAA
jgi:H/ACA ribonucleoprotein complex subunit 2